MSEYVWCVRDNVIFDPDLGINVMGPEWDESLKTGIDKLERRQRHRRGEIMGADELPKLTYKTESAARSNRTTVPNFSGHGFFFVSKLVADIMQQFDLGNARFFPVEFFEMDKITPCTGGQVFCLNIGNIKETFSFEDSPKLLDAQGAERLRVRPSVNSRTADDDIALSRSCTTSPDIWVEAKVHNTFFMSDALVQALQAAGLAGDFHFLRVRVV